MDYTTVTQRITIPAGDTEAFLNITMTDDNFQENTESFIVQLAIIPGVTSAEVNTASPNPATVEITDNDRK